MFKKFFQKSPKNEDSSRDPYFKNNVTTIPKPSNIPHHSSSHSPFRNDNSGNSSVNSITPSHKSNNPSSNNSKLQTQNYLNNNGMPPINNYGSKIGPNFISKRPQKELPLQPKPNEMKESFSNYMGSISEYTTEGKNLVQNLPLTKDVSASKIPTSNVNNPGMAFKIKNKDTGEVYDLRENPKIDKFIVNKDINYKGLWEEKNKLNKEFIFFAKQDNIASVMDVLDKKKHLNRPDVNFKGENDWTALHYACYNGNLKMVNFLLYQEAIIDSENIVNQTPLIVASQKGFEEIVQCLSNVGSEINHVDYYSNSALHYASLYGHFALLEFLVLKPSINLFLRNKENKTAYDLCKNDTKMFFEKLMLKKKQLCEKNNDVLINNAYPSSSKVQGGVSKEFKNSNSSLNTTHTLSDEPEKIGPNSFLILGLIGKGSFGEVYLVEKKNTKSLHAMKVLHKSKIMKHNLVKYAMTERNVLSLTNHPFIVRLNSAFQTADKLFLILDYCPGGDLAEHLQKEKKFDEDRVRIHLAEILLALEDLHKRDIIFRDLKPDNIVLDVNGHAKLTDFGLSKEGVLDHSQGARSFCGSVAYLAPEMLKRCGHGKAVDWYLLGVVMYELLVGIPPYYANNRDELFQNIEKAPLKLPSYITNDAKSLLKALLQRNPAKRLGSGKGDAEEIKSHPFFSNINWNEAYEMKLKPPKPNRKLRISTKIDQDVFEVSSIVEPDKEYIPGWSFANVEKKEKLNNLFKKF